MFITIVLMIICLILLLSYRDWLKYGRLTKKDKQTLLVQISKLILLEEWQEAKKMILPLIQKTGAGHEERILYIQVLRGTKDFKNSLEVARSALKECPDDLYFRLEEGITLLEMEEPEAALESLLVAKPILRSPAEMVHLATAYLKVGMAEKSWEILEPLLDKKPLGSLLVLAGDTQLDLGGYSKACAFYSKAIELGWNTHIVQTQLGHAHRHLGNYNEAERIYRKILEKDSSDVAATLGLGACMEERGYYLKALMIYQAGRAWGKKDPLLLTQAATCALYSGRFSYAEEYYRIVLEMKGPTADLLFHLGYSLEKQQKWSEAEECYTTATVNFPEDVRGYKALAWLFGVGLATNMSAESGLAFAEKALAIQEDSLSWEILSAVQARAGHFEAAYQIQEHLAHHDKTQSERIRRNHLLKNLRKQLPLEEAHLYHRLVAA